MKSIWLLMMDVLGVNDKMKPIVIIAIAVVCSVVAVYGVLAIDNSVSDYQYQIALEENAIKEKNNEQQFLAIYTPMNREICFELYSNQLTRAGDVNPYAYCLENGAYSTTEMMQTKCYGMVHSFGGSTSIDSTLVGKCEEESIVNFYNSFIPKLEKLSEKERELMGFDSKEMDVLRDAWNTHARLLKIHEITIDALVYGKK